MNFENGFINKNDEQSANDSQNQEIAEKDKLEPYYNWMKKARQAIDQKKEDMAGKKEFSAISGRDVSAFDSKSAHLTLSDYGELSFIQFASEQGSQEEIDCALDMLNKYYADRDDLRIGLYANKGDLKTAENLITKSNDESLYLNIAMQAKAIDAKNPGFMSRVMESVKDSNKSLYRDLERETEG